MFSVEPLVRALVQVDASVNVLLIRVHEFHDAICKTKQTNTKLIAKLIKAREFVLKVCISRAPAVNAFS